MAILVTGAKGFVGQYLAGDIVAFEGDIRDHQTVRAAMRETRPTGVVHLAGVASVGEAARDGALAWEVNVLGTFNIAQAMLEFVPEARLIFASSSAVYGASSPGELVAETTPPEPLSRYGATKAAAETMLLQMAQEGLRVVCFRPFNHTGPAQSAGYVIPAFARQIARIEKGLQEPVMRTGNLDVVRDFLDVRDVTRAYLRAFEADSHVLGECVNLASGRPRTLRWMLEHMLGRAAVRIRQETDPALLRPNDVPFVGGDISKAKALLGWEPSIPLEQTLDDVLDYWRSVVLE